MTYWTKSEERKALAMHQNGCSLGEIAQEVMHSKSAISDKINYLKSDKPARKSRIHGISKSAGGVVEAQAIIEGEPLTTAKMKLGNRLQMGRTGWYVDGKPVDVFTLFAKAGVEMRARGE